VSNAAMNETVGLTLGCIHSIQYSDEHEKFWTWYAAIVTTHPPPRQKKEEKKQDTRRDRKVIRASRSGVEVHGYVCVERCSWRVWRGAVGVIFTQPVLGGKKSGLPIFWLFWGTSWAPLYAIPQALWHRSGMSLWCCWLGVSLLIKGKSK
jgi:hypothetical protein